MIKQKKAFLTCIIMLVVTITIHAQVKNLFINSYDNIVKINSATVPSKISYTGISNGFEAIAHTEDNSGKILFFVNSSGVYNTKSELMPGSIGIYANPSTAEINICPFPGNSNKYYLIYNDELCSELYYSVVDMGLNKGLGDVTQLNTLLDTTKIAEGLELIKRPCTNTFWLVAYACETGFKRYVINEQGISPGTLIEPYKGPSIFLGRGELDYHNGKLGLSFANSPDPVTFLCSFDSDSGKITNPKTILLPSGGNGVYGLEFSPDATKAYMTEWYENINNNLFQYDFETDSLKSYYITSTPAAPTMEVTGPGQIELGANGKLYIPFDGGNQITVISNPNSGNPTFSRITTSSVLALGVSDHIQSDLYKPANDFTFEHFCLGETTRFKFQPSECAVNTAELLWDFGDAENRKKNTSRELSPTHIYNAAGEYRVTLYVTDPQGRDTITHTVFISPRPKVGLGKDTAICPGDSVLIDAGNRGMNYKWSTGEFTQKVQISKAGKYTVQVMNKGCASSDDISIKFNPIPTVNLGNDLWLCDAAEKLLNAGTSSNSYIWSTGESTPKIKIRSTGSYSVKASNGLCNSYDTIDVVFQKSPAVKLGNDTIICNKNSIELNAGKDGDSYLWSTGETTTSVKVKNTGLYHVTVSKGTCLTQDTILVTVKDEIPVISVPAKFSLKAEDASLEILTQNIKSFHIKIYSDTGKLIYESTTASWNGITNSKSKAEPGVYKYMIEYNTKCNSTIQSKQGTFAVTK